MTKVIFVVGPTASGKSDLALNLAERNQGAIVNCDSVQLYKSLDIGSAKPSADDFKRVPHFLFDFVDEGEEITAGFYQRQFFATMKELENQFPLVFVVGGTGFYFQAIEKGMYPTGAADAEVTRQVEAELLEAGGPERLYQELKSRDPEAAAKISANDHYRIARAVEMMRVHGKPVTEIKKEFADKAAPFPYPLLKLGIRGSREELAPRVERRTQKMLETGLLDEVRALLDRGLENWGPLQSVGYKESVDFLQGKIPDVRQLQALIVQNTLRLAKRQRTWFQRDPEIHWLAPHEIEKAQHFIDTFSAVQAR
jgi:tRNA dimethylallyltransferase